MPVTAFKLVSTCLSRSLLYMRYLSFSALFSSLAYQLSCLLSLLQPTPLQPISLLDRRYDAAGAAEDSASPANASTPIFPLPPAQHRIRISMLQYLGFPVVDPFLGPAIVRR